MRVVSAILRFFTNLIGGLIALAAFGVAATIFVVALIALFKIHFLAAVIGIGPLGLALFMPCVWIKDQLVDDLYW